MKRHHLATSAILFALTPALAFGLNKDSLKEINLEYSSEKEAYNIVYLTDANERYTASLTAAAKSEERTYNRLYNVTKNVDEFEGITREEVRALFDYQKFDLERTLIAALFAQIIQLMLENE